MNLTKPSLFGQFLLSVINHKWEYEADREAGKQGSILSAFSENFLWSDRSPKYSSGEELIDPGASVVILLRGSANILN